VAADAEFAIELVVHATDRDPRVLRHGSLGIYSGTAEGLL